MKKIITLSVVVSGFSAMAAQIIFMREFLITFWGNELSVGFILSSWLLLGAVGSSLLGRLSDRIKPKIVMLWFCQITLSILLPLTIFLIKSIKVFLNTTTGEIIPLFPVALCSFLILAPLCIIFGFMFPLYCRTYSYPQTSSVLDVGRVYLWESLGSMSAGLVVSFFLISLLDSLHIVSILVFLNILSALLLTLFSQKTRLKPFLVGVTSVVFMAMALMWVTKGWSHFGNFLLKRQWSGYQLLTHKDSIYGNIALAKKDSQLSFFNNGLLLYTIPDKQRAEESVHFALLEHPAPQNILLVGGGVAGLIEEILKHPVNKVDYIELDPLIIKIAKNYLAEEYRYPLEEPRVIINSLDGRLFIKTTKERYDCVILNLGDPCIAQLNRYYTVEFFQEVKRVLRKGGIIAFSVSSSENYLNRELRLYLKSIHASLEKVFKDIKVIPLDTAHFLAADEEDVLSYDYNLLTKRAKERRLDISYVREYYLFSKLSSQQIAHFEDSLKAVGDVKINYDLRPITYFYNTVFWTTYFRDSIFISFFKAIQKVSLGNIILVVLSIAVLFGLIFRNHPNFHRKSVILAILVMGFSQMVLQVIILLSFQFIYGYLFYRLGLVLTFFMVGLALGVLWITKIIKKIKEELAIFIRIQSGILIYALFLLLILFWLKNSKTEILYWLGANVVFLILPLMAGMLGGMHFPLANKIYLRGSAEVGRSGGIIYGVDLLGSSLGAFLSGIYLIPVLGITQTCFLVAIFNLLAVILLAFSYRLK